MSEINPLSIAPMIQWTDRHWRHMMRSITKKTLLYTEMTMDNALIHNRHNLTPFIGHSEIEHPLAIQLGGNDPETLAEAAALCESYANYSEINLNCGCPSNRAKRAGFGAELMLEPKLVSQILYTIKRRVTHTDVTVKCRLGLRDRDCEYDSWDELVNFILAVKSVGITRVILHSRICELRGKYRYTLLH